MRNYVLHDFSAQKVLKAIEQNFIGFNCACVRVGQGDVYEESELTWIFTGTPLRFFNGVMRTALASSDPDAAIEAVLNFFQSRQQLMIWWVNPLVRPSDLSRRLQMYGLTLNRKEVAMAIDLHTINQTISSPHGLVIERIQDEQAMREWVSTMGRGWPINERLLPSYSKLLAGVSPLEHPVRPCYLARLNGEPVATSALYCADGVAGIYEVSTVPSARRQGIGSAITMAALLDARAMGYRMAILQAELMGESVYRRLGFVAYCTFDGYCWTPPTRNF